MKANGDNHQKEKQDRESLKRNKTQEKKMISSTDWPIDPDISDIKNPDYQQKQTSPDAKMVVACNTDPPALTA